VGKVLENVRISNFLDPSKSVEIEALMDTGATISALPQDVVDGLGLRKMRDTTVRCADNSRQVKSVYGVVTVEIQGRAGEFDVLAEPAGSQPLIGQIVLEQLDLIVDPGRRAVLPNPRSPDMPMVELL
jgi:clan AA aspartic protease